METLQTLLLVVQVLVAIGLIGLILVQHGKGADAGAAFGSGASSTVFGAQGSGNFLTKSTGVLALVFLLNSLALAYIANERVRENKSLMQGGGASIMQQEREQSPAQGEPDNTGKSAPDMPAVPE
jgi:preprotein translocase subunit SecG